MKLLYDSFNPSAFQRKLVVPEKPLSTNILGGLPLPADCGQLQA